MLLNPPDPPPLTPVEEFVSSPVDLKKLDLRLRLPLKGHKGKGGLKGRKDYLLAEENPEETEEHIQKALDQWSGDDLLDAILP